MKNIFSSEELKKNPQIFRFVLFVSWNHREEGLGWWDSFRASSTVAGLINTDGFANQDGALSTGLSGGAFDLFYFVSCFLGIQY